MPETGKGACLCGAVKFRTYGKLRDVVACHCTQCRVQSGHYWAATAIAEDELQLEGSENLTWFVSTPGFKRGFCKTCGSAMLWKCETSEEISIAAGAFEKPTGLKLTHHIYCADKGDYYEIGEPLRQFDQDSGHVVQNRRIACS